MPNVTLPELAVIQQIANIVEPLSTAEKCRVAAWLYEYANQDAAPTTGSELATLAPEGVDDADPAPRTFDTFAELYEAIAPKTGAQKAVVAGWWMENKQGQQSWKASEANKLLKQIDVRVSSISIVLTNAVKASDPMIEQLARLGTGERSRKTFCLSSSGAAFVENRLN